MAKANPAVGETVAQICNSAQVCATVPPEYAALVIALQSLITEINKGGDAFGPNNDALQLKSDVSALLATAVGPNTPIGEGLSRLSSAVLNLPQSVIDDLTRGPGDNNELVKLVRGIKIDIRL